MLEVENSVLMFLFFIIIILFPPEDIMLRCNIVYIMEIFVEFYWAFHVSFHFGATVGSPSSDL